MMRTGFVLLEGWARVGVVRTGCGCGQRAWRGCGQGWAGIRGLGVGVVRRLGMGVVRDGRYRGLGVDMVRAGFGGR